MQNGQRDPGRGPGRLAVVSIGPGYPEFIIPRARQVVEDSQLVVGYKVYLDLLKPVLTTQELVSTGMMGEMERCRLAIDRALAGEKVALVSSGDAGIYGMAALVLEICHARNIRLGPLDAGGKVDLPFEIIPGIPALAAGASLLGAPLTHDFASISLSDLLTPWETIQKRIELAAQGDFIIVLYNPKSKKRDWQLGAVRDLLLKTYSPQTPVGIVRRAMRQGQEIVLTNLAELLNHPIDMQTIIIVGNSTTYIFGQYMITPRGYLNKYELGTESK
jgi:precorrin-3B C17-methyltransferase